MFGERISISMQCRFFPYFRAVVLFHKIKNGLTHAQHYITQFSVNQSLSICGGGDIRPRNGITIKSHGFRFVLANLAELWPAPFHDRPKLRQKIDYPRAHFFGSFLQQAIKMPARGSSRAAIVP